MAPDPGRRAFLRGKISRSGVSALRPPWAALDRFTEMCERCDDCIRACPEHVIFRGDGGFPEVDFNRGECTFCGKCADACGAGLFPGGDRDIESAWRLSVAIDASSCLSMNAVVCRICGDRCEPEAIRFELRTGAMSIPKIDEASCSGCGACQFGCPVNAVTIGYRTAEARVA